MIFFHSKQIYAYLTLPLAVISFIAVGFLICNFTGITALVSDGFLAYINKDTQTIGRVAGQNTGIYVTVGQSNADYVGNDNNIIQQAVNYVNSQGGGTVHIKAGTYNIKDKIILYSNIILEGDGSTTILKKTAGDYTKLTNDANRNDMEIYVADPSLLIVGGGIRIRDDNTNRCYGEQLNSIVAIEGSKVTLMDPVGTDSLGFVSANQPQYNFLVSANAVVQEVYPLVAAFDAQNVVVQNLSLDGNKNANQGPKMEFGCRGGLVNFYKCQDSQIINLKAYNYNGDGISIQMGTRNKVMNSEVYDNAWEGVHPGTLSTYYTIENNNIRNNGASGIYLCGGVDNGLVRNNEIHHNNANGINTGKDDNVIVMTLNNIHDNKLSGIYYREYSIADQSENNIISFNQIINNAVSGSGSGIFINKPHKDIYIFENEIKDTRTTKLQNYGVYIASTEVGRVEVCNNDISGNKSGDIFGTVQACSCSGSFCSLEQTCSNGWDNSKLRCCSTNCDGQNQPQCSDGIDNDSDGQIDHPNDPDCTSASDDSEAGTLPPACPYNTCASSQTCANWHNQSILCCVTACQDPAPAPSPTPTDDPISRACFDATLGPCYPRRSFFHFGNAPAEWYAKFDLVGNSTSGARAAKSINPAVYIINTGVDWNVEADKDNKSDDWNLKGINGDSLIIPGGGYSRPQSDITMSCPVIGSERYNEYVAGETADLLCSSCDGVLNQGSWGKPLGSTSNFNNSKDTTGIDMDRSCITNGGTVPVSSCNDWYEHNEAWMRQTWQEGIKFTIDSVRTAIGPNKILINNTGGIRPDEFPYINNYFSQMNGEFQEHIQSISSFTYLKNAMDTWRSQGREPHTNILGANPSGDKDNFSYVRFFMGISLIGETYFESGADNNHHYVHYYDELDVNLGYPAEEAEQIKNTGQNGRGVWVRFFDNGVVIFNADENNNTVSVSDIQNLDGYAGPYYRFKGGQDATRNNGEQFSSITLNGSLASTSGSNRLYVGDSVLLVKNPTTMVTDIIIDDSEFNTSPGSEPAQLSAQWKFHICPAGGLNMPCSCDLTEKYWSQNCRSWQNLFGLSWNTSRAGTAVFTPTINVPGDYAVYEWHGKVKNQIMASNVSYTVNYAGGGSQTFTINQENNAGQWNKLGVFNLAVGTGNNVTVNASGADETVVADAIRFVYQGNTGDIKGPPGNYISTYLKADFNCDNKVNLTDFGILLSNWGTPAKMNNYKNASCSQEMSLDLRVDSRINNLDLAILLSCWGMPVEANQPDCFGN